MYLEKKKKRLIKLQNTPLYIYTFINSETLYQHYRSAVKMKPTLTIVWMLLLHGGGLQASGTVLSAALSYLPIACVFL